MSYSTALSKLLRPRTLDFTFVTALLLVTSNAFASFQLIPDSAPGPSGTSPAARLLVGHWSGVTVHAEFRTELHLQLASDTTYVVQFRTVNSDGHVVDQGVVEGAWQVVARSLELLNDSNRRDSLPFFLDGDALTLRFADDEAPVELRRHEGTVVEFTFDPTTLITPMPYLR